MAKAVKMARMIKMAIRAQSARFAILTRMTKRARISEWPKMH